MTDLYSGIRVHDVRRDLIDRLYKNKEIEIWDNRYNWYENLYVVVKDETGSQSSALAKVEGNKLKLLHVDRNLSVSGIKPRNKEQCFALDALLTDSIQIVVLTGKAGTGKSLLTLASIMSLYEAGGYDKIVICKDMTQIRKKEIGYLPGDMDDKFLPHNQGALCNMEYLMGGDEKKVQDLIEQYKIKFVPLSIILGSSWNNSLIWCDEVQNISCREMWALGTRMSEGSKMILTGAFGQVFNDTVKQNNSGLCRFVNHPLVKASPIAASIHLLKNERGEAARLFEAVFGEE
jgi:PhoH-like ATPase